jgi:hypothetical protein
MGWRALSSFHQGGKLANEGLKCFSVQQTHGAPSQQIADGNPIGWDRIRLGQAIRHRDRAPQLQSHSPFFHDVLG